MVVSEKSWEDDRFVVGLKGVLSWRGQVGQRTGSPSEKMPFLNDNCIPA